MDDLHITTISKSGKSFPTCFSTGRFLEVISGLTRDELEDIKCFRATGKYKDGVPQFHHTEEVKASPRMHAQNVVSTVRGAETRSLAPG